MLEIFHDTGMRFILVSKKIVIFSDLHSNIEALTTVVENEENVDQWICLGDFVGLFPGVNETINLMREIGAIRVWCFVFGCEQGRRYCGHGFTSYKLDKIRFNFDDCIRV